MTSSSNPNATFLPRAPFSCDLCGSFEFSIKHWLNRWLGIREGTAFNIVQCAGCGLISLYPLPDDKALQIIYSDYIKKKDRLKVEMDRLREIYPEKLDLLTKYSSGKSLLDIGAGIGTFVHLARKAGFEAVGVEFERQQCEAARELWNIDLINGKIEDVYKTIGKFDIINLHHVLEHVVSPKRLIEIIHELLNTDGVCRIEVPNQFFNIHDRIRYYFNRRPMPKEKMPDHLFFFSIKTLKIYVENHFTIVELNQFTKKETEITRWTDLPKSLYRKVTQKFNISTGGMIEVYMRKTNANNSISTPKVPVKAPV